MEYKIVRRTDWEDEFFQKELVAAGWELIGYSEFYFNGEQYIPKYAELTRKDKEK